MGSGHETIFLVAFELMTCVTRGGGGCARRAGAISPVGQVSTGPLFSPSALTADLGDYDVRGSIDEVREVLS